MEVSLLKKIVSKFNSRSLAVIVFVVGFSALAHAGQKTEDLLNKGSKLSPAVKQAMQDLVNEKAIEKDSFWTEEAIEKLQVGTFNKEQLLELRANSELSKQEVKDVMVLENDNLSKEHDKGDQDSLSDFGPSAAQGHATRPAPFLGALWVDIYQESPVMIKYKKEDQANSLRSMSFEVVTRWVSEGGSIVPHFVRANLVSPGQHGHSSSVGEFDIDSRHRKYVSNKYGSRMDYAQFFIGGIALHQTPVENYGALGGLASHGCIRHHELDADAMWNLIGEVPLKNVNIAVHREGAAVKFADGTEGTQTSGGFAGKVNTWLNRSIGCTRHGKGGCTNKWE